ncbi:MAG: N-6 DNA methylase, partial [Thermomicrobia bacterium]|nr:N-6 DNA methylase [Thermomicrobia bacterium]
MRFSMHIAPTNKAFDAYETTLADYRGRKVTNEGAVRFAFQTLLTTLAPARWNVLGEQTMPSGIRMDGVIKDGYNLTRGYWEAKDTADDLDEEIRKKTAKGYPLTNIIFEDTRRAVLYQNKQQAMDVPLADRKQLADLLAQFFSYEEPDIVAFERAVEEFKGQIPDLAAGLKQTIHHEREQTNRAFIAAFNDFAQTCRTSIDPNIADMALEEMLVQHLLTERLFRTIFNNPDFTKRNVIAAEIEKVIDALASRSFSRSEFLGALDRYYRPIEEAARGITDWSEKQTFLNTVYERFFQGFSTRQADTHGVVYTPQAIVDFMVSSVAEVLQAEFGTSLAAPDVAILDPATGTGNFIVNIMRRITDPTALKRKYTSALFANEIMLLPYYIAAMNIEHEYYVRTEAYEPFDGLCFADTLDMAQSPQLGLFSEQNTARVQREKDAPITVIIGNPPYNVGQKNENDNNKNRAYAVVDKRIRETYGKDSRATLLTKIYDAYVKFFRWASDRLQGCDGIVCFVSNNGFLDGTAFDGFRR